MKKTEHEHHNPSSFEQFNYSLTIKEHHLDTFGHVNNATYLQLLEEARWEFLHSRGFDLPTIQALRMGPIVLECTIQFIKELRLRQDIVIESQMLSYEGKIGKMQQSILTKDGVCCARATLTFGFFDMTSRKLILPSTQWLHAIGIIEK